MPTPAVQFLRVSGVHLNQVLALGQRGSRSGTDEVKGEMEMRAPRVFGVALVGYAVLLGPGALGTTATDPGGTTGGAAYDPANPPGAGQDPAWLDLKLAHRLVRLPTGEVGTLAVAPTSYPNSMNLPYNVTSKIVEPQGNLYDDHHASYADSNYWNFCGEGATAVALYYWKPANITGWAAGNFREPYGSPMVTTYWTSSDTGTSSDTSDGYATTGRNYVMYLAEQVYPPSYGSAGEFDFTSKVTTASSLLDALNWEASGHSANWKNFIYTWRTPITQAQLLADVHNDIYSGGFAVVVDLNTYAVIGGTTYHLPNWNRSVFHSITIIGYNDANATYTYTDTCGVACGSTQNGGTNTVSQSTMWKLIANMGAGYAW